MLLFKVKIFLWLSLLLSSLAVAHCQEGCKQHPKKVVFVDEYSCQTKCLLKVPNLAQTSYFSLEKPHCVICFRKKTLQVHNGWNFFLKDHPYFHSTTFLSVTNVFQFLAYSIIIQMSKNVRKPLQKEFLLIVIVKRHLCLT